MKTCKQARRSVAWMVVGTICWAGVCVETRAEEQQDVQQAEYLVREALKQEMIGQAGDRQALLQAALEKSPDCPQVKWQMGLVEVDGKWLTLEQATKQAEEDLKLARYRKQRDATPDTVEGHLALAEYCESVQLADECRAHYTRVVELSPEHATARAKLGFRLINGMWVNQQEIDEARLRSQQAVRTVHAWRGKLEAIRKGLTSGVPRIQEQAAAKLAEIKGPETIPALEALFCAYNEDMALGGVLTIAEMQGHEASQALARQAVFSPWELVRATAARQLSARAQDHFVPAMLAAMYSPVQSRAELFTTPNGRIMYRHVFFREGQNERQTAILDTMFRRGSGNARDASILATGAALQAATAREATVARVNLMTAEMNGRISEALASATGQNLNANPNDWWNWWNEANEIFVSQKAERQLYRIENVEIDVPQISLPQTSDCLGAETPVWTMEGPVRIDQIKVGDCVLSQHPETGELTYKPVLATTIRPAGRLVKITIGYDTFHCSGGHPFWLSGKGWKKARDLSAGNLLHGVTQSCPIDVTSEGRFDQTYNLVVADFHTYFVGKHQLLSHDNTVRQPTDAVIPGLLKAE